MPTVISETERIKYSEAEIREIVFQHVSKGLSESAISIHFDLRDEHDPADW